MLISQSNSVDCAEPPPVDQVSIGCGGIRLSQLPSFKPRSGATATSKAKTPTGFLFDAFLTRKSAVDIFGRRVEMTRNMSLLLYVVALIAVVADGPQHQNKKL